VVAASLASFVASKYPAATDELTMPMMNAMTTIMNPMPMNGIHILLAIDCMLVTSTGRSDEGITTSLGALLAIVAIVSSWY
jgi:hypothetical protein